jgi:hypothetical protein
MAWRISAALGSVCLQHHNAWAVHQRCTSLLGSTRASYDRRVDWTDNAFVFDVVQQGLIVGLVMHFWDEGLTGELDRTERGRCDALPNLGLANYNLGVLRVA